MSIKQNGGVFGRNPTFNDVTIEGQLTFDGDIDINSDLTVDGNIDVTGEASIGTVSSAKTLTVGGTGLRVESTASADFYSVGQDAIVSNNGTSNFKFWNNGVESIRIDSSSNVKVLVGNLVIGTSGKGIDFSATAGTGTSELLSDYEEGTFTPQLLFGGASVGMTGSFVGRYTKVGRVVYYTAVIYLSAKGSSTGNTTISGFPFASSASSTFYEGKMDTDNVTGMAYQFVATMPTSATTLNVYVNVNGTQNNVGDGSYADNSRLYITGFYEV